MTINRVKQPTPIFQSFHLLDENQAYDAWRTRKLAELPTNPADLMVDINNPAAATAVDIENIQANCTRANLSFYRTDTSTPTTREDLNTFANMFSLRTAEAHRSAGTDGIVALEVTDNKAQAGYIPYTNRRLS